MTFKIQRVAWAATAVGLSVAARAEEPAVRNVMFILMDDQSCDLSFLGTPGLSTPNLDGLVQGGVWFSNAFAACASCAPSRASILTGMYPHSNGHWRNTHTPTLRDPDIEFTRQSSKLDPVRIDESIPTLIEILKEQGFFTAITHKWHLSPPWKYPFEVRNPVQHNPEQFKAAMSGLIRQSEDRPFFILANIEPPHRSFRNSAYFKQMMKDGPLPDRESIEIPDYMPDLPAVRQDLQEYYASVEVADACAGAILQALEESGRKEETLIIYTSDNGMSMFRSKASGYPAGTHMPLAVAGPGVAAGRSCEQAVSLIDLMPTMLDALELPTPPNVQGKSLWAWLTGAGELPDRKWIFTEHNSHGPDPREFFPQRVATDGRWYYILNLDPTKPQKLPADLTGEEPWRNPGYSSILPAKEQFPEKTRFLEEMLEGLRPEEELYDLEKDRWAVNNLASNPEYGEVLRTMRSAVDDWRSKTGDIEKSPHEFKQKKAE
jgi:N-sulfoglucosamine sulfohydrolase